MFDHNEGFVGLPSLENEDIPGITSSYISQEPSSYFSSSSLFFLLLMFALGGMFYKMRKKTVNEDDFVKAEDNPVYEKFFNPFNRRNKDNDDDFDKVL